MLIKNIKNDNDLTFSSRSEKIQFFNNKLDLLT